MQPQTKGDLIKKNTHTCRSPHTGEKKNCIHHHLNPQSHTRRWTAGEELFDEPRLEVDEKGQPDSAGVVCEWVCVDAVPLTHTLSHTSYPNIYQKKKKKTSWTHLNKPGSFLLDRCISTITSNSSSSLIMKPSSNRDQNKDWCAALLSSPAVMSSIILRKELRCNA